MSNQKWTQEEIDDMEALVRDLVFKLTGGINIPVVFPESPSQKLSSQILVTNQLFAVDRPDVLAILEAFAASDMAAVKAGGPLPLQSDIEAIAKSMYFGPEELDMSCIGFYRKIVKEMKKAEAEGTLKCRRMNYLNHTQCCDRRA
ncbi:hypothetical protein VE03_00376 [Pseudogymnoascus sp. 23342-1-I1]|nr:hypothetical protein VE03_00376 [Pseudogymnoascus sp. 23342-1-I1]